MDSTAKIWKYISSQLFLAKNNPEETIYQKTITDILTDPDFLGWPEDQVIREYGIKMGSTKKCDIVLLDSTKTPFIAIEVKLASSPSDGVEQLGSYMDRCTPRLRYGITIKDSINLFYDEDTGHSIHSENDAIFSVSFDNTDYNGEKFVNLFKYSNFNLNTFKDFCESRLLEKQKVNEKKEKIAKILHSLTGPAGNEIIKEAISKYFIDKGTIDAGEENIIDEVLTTTSLIINPNANLIVNSGSLESNSKSITSQIIYQPSKEAFCELLKKQVCYRHFILKDGRIKTERWNSRKELDISVLDPNVKTTNFYKNNKGNIEKIILSPDPEL